METLLFFGHIFFDRGDAVVHGVIACKLLHWYLKWLVITIKKNDTTLLAVGNIIERLVDILDSLVAEVLCTLYDETRLLNTA